MLLKLIDRLEHYPEARERLKAHVGDKEREMDRAERILADMGETTSGSKDSMFSAMGAMTGAMSGAWKDDILQNSMLTYGLASYEIALYEALMALADPPANPAPARSFRNPCPRNRLSPTGSANTSSRPWSITLSSAPKAAKRHTELGRVALERCI